MRIVFRMTGTILQYSCATPKIRKAFRNARRARMSTIDIRRRRLRPAAPSLISAAGALYFEFDR
jgi:hypothetical protein